MITLLLRTVFALITALEPRRRTLECPGTPFPTDKSSSQTKLAITPLIGDPHLHPRGEAVTAKVGPPQIASDWPSRR